MSEEPRGLTATRLLKEMAERCSKNIDNDFAGTVVIFPPEGDAIAYIILDPKHSSAMFWSNIKVKAEIALAELDQQARQNAAFPRG